ncbi:MAG: hypothetical protein PHE87_10900 [Victivallaceae bacterium]|nr:hypothetical protein [Victivallaceae bacterium]
MNKIELMRGLPYDSVTLATIVGALVEVPVMLFLVKLANRTRHWFPVK